MFVFEINIFNTRDDYYYYCYYQCGGTASRCIFPILGFKGPQWGLVKLMCLYVCLYVCWVVCLLRFAFWRTFKRPRIAHNACGRRLWSQRVYRFKIYKLICFYYVSDHEFILRRAYVNGTKPVVGKKS